MGSGSTAAGVGGEKAPGIGSGGRLVISASDGRGEATPSDCSELSKKPELSLRSSAAAGNDDNDS